MFTYECLILFLFTSGKKKLHIPITSGATFGWNSLSKMLLSVWDRVCSKVCRFLSVVKCLKGLKGLLHIQLISSQTTASHVFLRHPLIRGRIHILVMVSWPGPVGPKHPQTKTLPPPCFTVSTRYFSWNAVFGWCQACSGVQIIRL